MTHTSIFDVSKTRPVDVWPLVQVFLNHVPLLIKEIINQIDISQTSVMKNNNSSVDITLNLSLSDQLITPSTKWQSFSMETLNWNQFK